VLGFTNTFSYSSPVGVFDLTVFFQAQAGGKIFNQNRALLELGTGYVNASRVLLNRYSETNTNTDVKAPYQDPAFTISDRFIEDASYVRLKNISLGYKIPTDWAAKIRASSVRLYISAQNAYTWTNYTGYDPEVSRSGQTLINKGIDFGVYPNSKTFLGGVSVTF
jgi:TonB-dependent starch-binding outer membrane protein SusC